MVEHNAKEQLLVQINSVLESYELWDISTSGGHADGSAMETNRIRVRLHAVVERVAPHGSAYWNEAISIASDPEWSGNLAPRFAAVLFAVRDDIEAGWLATVEELIHADTFTDFLDMAHELLEKGYKDPAAVLAGSVLESHLRGLCAKHDIATLSEGGQGKKAETINADLRKADVYPSSRQKQVITWQDIRNRAAHGEFDKFADQEVKLMIMGIRDFIAAYPA